MKRVFFLFLALLTLLLPFRMASAAEIAFGERTDGMAEVTGVRVASGTDKVRIVVDASKPVTIKQMALSSPERVAVDIGNAWLSPKVKRVVDTGGRFTGSLRIAQFNKNTVRIVVETKVGRNNYKVFTLKGGPVPGRVVLDFGNLSEGSAGRSIAIPDVGGTPAGTPKPKPQPHPQARPEVKNPKADPQTSRPQHPAANAPDDTGKDPDPGIAEITGLKGRKITIDPGHGGSDSGAIGPTGIMEKSIALRIANELHRLLVQEGATVYMTRTADTEVSPKGAAATDIEELQARCDVANKHNSDIFVSIHMDSFPGRDVKGTTGYYYTNGSAASQKLADCIRQGVVDQIHTPSRGTKGAGFYVIKHTDMPATLIEVAFVSNPEEEKLLDSEEGIKRAAQGIADGIADYFG
ncbi:N-acetylmuramoyl-L-alanine amidase [uncultured Mitsuokella sp.]|uniref:N-acetylmuramoyl-L-alanine amidase n=1 Tax=uncultured Mitsuokella sp. TaxID=453120 RepID=UPI00261FD1F8|nr:N-acetylmuramoyl-L-alanine amidase [uncultured Mitsuokella sp.]